jgi:ornithine carbamoyltransferase
VRTDPFIDPARAPVGVPHHMLGHRRLWSLDTLSRRDLQSLLDCARAIERAARSATPCRALRGMNIARLGPGLADTGAAAFDRAATELGAQVTQIRPSESRLGEPGEAKRTAGMLGRLYDAIDCSGLPDDQLLTLEREAGVPVFNGLAGREHPLRVLLELLALQALGQRPLATLRVRVGAAQSSARDHALRQAAALAGIELQTSGSTLPCEADFELGDDDTLRTGAGDVVDRNAVAESRSHALQALLVAGLG